MARKGNTATVLIIEDDADIQNFVARVLELEGYQVLKTDNAERGMEIIRERQPDIVVLDLRLPGRDGWSVLEEVRHDKSLAKIPVVVISAVAETAQRKRTLRMGATKYLIKPLSANRLAKAVTSTLEQGGKRRDAASKVTDTVY